MAKRDLHAKAVAMRLRGLSYSQIKRELGISKSTLSCWLRDYPLPEERLRALRDFSEVRIERYRETRRKQRESRWKNVLEKVAVDVGKMNRREMFIAGLFLYWGEGSKTTRACTSLSNTDPAMLRFYIDWLQCLGVSRSRLKVHVHLYSDMNVEDELIY